MLSLFNFQWRVLYEQIQTALDTYPLGLCTFSRIKCNIY